MMFGDWSRIEDDGPHLDFIRLYNEWEEHTSMMSVGEFETDEWYALVEYGKAHEKEFARFVIDYINDIGGTRMICSMVDHIIGCPFKFDRTGWVDCNGMFAKAMYKEWCRLCIEDKLVIGDDGKPLTINETAGRLPIWTLYRKEIAFWLNKHFNI